LDSNSSVVLVDLRLDSRRLVNSHLVVDSDNLHSVVVVLDSSLMAGLDSNRLDSRDSEHLRLDSSPTVDSDSRDSVSSLMADMVSPTEILM
jgi:hypothetical protein